MPDADQPTGQTYELRTIEDFLALTPRQREAAAQDLRLHLNYVSVCERMYEQTDGLVAIDFRNPEIFRWVDDGQHITTVNIVGSGDELLGTFTRDHGGEFGGEGE